ncbi:MAG: hypothetical protein J6D87_06165 [Clostridia bacterium]|nr:hypothetical protein [Clostridia bacterium]
MKCAFLILAHTDPKQLRRLVHTLDHPGFDFFIHVDKKCNLRDYGFEGYSLSYSKLTVLQKRYRIRWGDISIVKATIAIYHAAMSADRYDRFVTLSGQDYPILPNDVLAEKLSAPRVEWIMGNILEPKEYHKVENFYFWKLGGFKKYFTLLFSALGIRKKKYITVDQKKWDVYFAPQWHALSSECVAYILSTLEAHPHILKYFKYAYAPDELLIPTILFNSSEFRVRALASAFPEGTHYNQKTALHYINYEPRVEILQENRYYEIMSSQKLFCRKVKTDESDQLMDMIDKANQSERIPQHEHKT